MKLATYSVSAIFSGKVYTKPSNQYGFQHKVQQTAPMSSQVHEVQYHAAPQSEFSSSLVPSLASKPLLVYVDPLIIVPVFISNSRNLRSILVIKEEDAKHGVMSANFLGSFDLPLPQGNLHLHFSKHLAGRVGRLQQQYKRESCWKLSQSCVCVYARARVCMTVCKQRPYQLSFISKGENHPVLTKAFLQPTLTLPWYFTLWLNPTTSPCPTLYTHTETIPPPPPKAIAASDIK